PRGGAPSTCRSETAPASPARDPPPSVAGTQLRSAYPLPRACFAAWTARSCFSALAFEACLPRSLPVFLDLSPYFPPCLSITIGSNLPPPTPGGSTPAERADRTGIQEVCPHGLDAEEMHGVLVVVPVADGQIAAHDDEEVAAAEREYRAPAHHR